MRKKSPAKFLLAESEPTGSFFISIKFSQSKMYRELFLQPK